MMKEQVKKYLVPGIMLLALYLVIRYWSFVEAAVLTCLTAASPLIIGGAVAYLLGILLSRYERWWFPKTKKKFLIKSRRVFCLVFAILTLLAIVALVVLLVIPQLWDAIALLLAELPGAMQKVLAFAESLEILPEDILAMLEGIDWKSQISSIFKTLFTGVGSVVNVAVSVVTTVLGSVFNGLLAVIFALYLLLGKEKLKRQGDRLLVRYMKPAITKKFEYLLMVLDDCFHKFIVGQCLEALILGVLCTLGMLIFQFPYATMVGALVAFTALIPVAGAYIGAGVGAFMILTVSPVKALLFLVYILILQQLEGNIIYPRVVGSSIGLPGIWVLAAVTVGGGVAGIPGMLLGVPLAAAAYRLIREDVARGPRESAQSDR